MSETDIQEGSSGHHKPIIFRAPPHVKKDRGTDFEPTFVSIGPYFHGQEKLSDMEKQKPQIALELEQTLKMKERNIIDALVVEFAPLEPRIRSCYADKDANYNPDGDKFLHMLALDCCFIIQLMISTLNDRFDFHGFIIRGLRSDLLLLENQIPLFILQAAYDLISKRTTSELHPLEEGLVRFLFLGMAWRPNDFNICGEDHHLLHFFWRRVWPRERPLKTAPFLSKRTSFHLRSQDERVFQTATVLHEKANIVFTHQKYAAGLDISFKNGRMEMPCLMISLNMRKLLLNLIAYEHFMDHQYRICMSYMLLMDALIDTDKDVTFLQEQDVLNNKLMHNIQAANFFNFVGNLCSVNHKDNFFRDLIDKVTNYYESPSKRQLANLRRNYCSSPWAVISLVAGSALLLMSFFQTFYTIYGYYNPRH